MGECCIGFNYIVGILIRFISPIYSEKDEENPEGLLGEEMAFWCLFAIMQQLNWRKYFVHNSPDLKQLQSDFVHQFKTCQPRIHAAMVNELENESIVEALLVSMPDRFLLPIFNYQFPVEVSKHIFDLFLWEQTGVDTLLRVFFKCLELQSDSILQLPGR